MHLKCSVPYIWHAIQSAYLFKFVCVFCRKVLQVISIIFCFEWKFWRTKIKVSSLSDNRTRLPPLPSIQFFFVKPLNESYKQLSLLDNGTSSSFIQFSFRLQFIYKSTICVMHSIASQPCQSKNNLHGI